MKILLTGADGFTGRHFAALAQQAGHEIIPLRADLMNQEALNQDVRAACPDVVLHLAGIAFVGHAHEESFYSVNVVGTTNLLDSLAQLKTPPKRVLLASSANIYGNSDQSPIAESQPPMPVNHYAMSKVAMELMARTYMDRLGIVIARPFNYTGPGQNEAFLIPKLAKHFALRMLSVELGNLHVEREFNDVRTVCQIYLALLDIGESGGVYNVCSGQPYALQEILDMFAKISGHSIQVKVNPAFVRSNEVHRLCGNPDKLLGLFAAHGVLIDVPPLQDTLQRMLTHVPTSL